MRIDYRVRTDRGQRVQAAINGRQLLVVDWGRPRSVTRAPAARSSFDPVLPPAHRNLVAAALDRSGRPP